MKKTVLIALLVSVCAAGQAASPPNDSTEAWMSEYWALRDKLTSQIGLGQVDLKDRYANNKALTALVASAKKLFGDDPFSDAASCTRASSFLQYKYQQAADMLQKGGDERDLRALMDYAYTEGKESAECKPHALKPIDKSKLRDTL